MDRERIGVGGGGGMRDPTREGGMEWVGGKTDSVWCCC